LQLKLVLAFQTCCVRVAVTVHLCKFFAGWSICYLCSSSSHYIWPHPALSQ